MSPCYAAKILLLLQLGLTLGLQQSPAFALFSRRPIPLSTCCVLSASDDVVQADVSSSPTSAEEDQTQFSYDWDEQFEELQMFMSEYGHCNFPTQNPSNQLEQKYPTLKRFCHEQRMEYKQRQSSRQRKIVGMSLLEFDRDVRLRQLDELGFEFRIHSAKWYDRYHELIQYSSENGHIRVSATDNNQLYNWVRAQRGRRRLETIPDSQIKLLEDIGFQWKSDLYDALWDAKYEELVAFRSKHGHLIVDHRSQLYSWMEHQTRQRSGKRSSALTDEQIRLLDEIEFPWKPQRYDLRWHAMYDELQRFQKKYGHCQPKISHMRLYKWSLDQQSKYRSGRLSPEQIELLERTGFRWEPPKAEWPRMYVELTEFCNSHGHLRVNQDDDQELYDWMDIQRQRYHGIQIGKPMPDVQIEKLEDIHFCWSLDWRDRTWHEKYTEAAEFFKAHTHIRVTKKENPSLYNWIKTQEKRYKEVKGQKPLSEEELEMLEQIEFPFLEGQPRIAWVRMYGELTRYQDENGGRFPTSHKNNPDLNRWMRQQRHRYRAAYGYAPLSDEQRSLLESIDFPMYPRGKRRRYWYEMYDELVDFRKQYGHFLVDKKEDPLLYAWADRQRVRYRGASNKTPLSKSEQYLLERIGFTWVSSRFEIGWQEKYNELVEFLEARGHFPRLSDDSKLERWTQRMRQIYRGNLLETEELSEYQIQQLDKIGFRW